MKFSLRFNNDLPVSDYIRLAQAAESAGFHQFWVSDDLFLRSGMIILSAVAQATSKIEIGSCILNPYTLNPAQIAMEAATLDELSGGRFNLGISAGAGEFLKWIGIHQGKPRTAVVETIQAINQLLAGEHAEIDGHFLQWRSEAYLRFKPLRRIPIYLGAMSPNMLRTIGSLADGGLPLLFPPEHYANILPLIAEGAKEAGRDMEAIDIAACIWCSISEDYQAAENVLRDKIAYYGYALSPLILQQLGLTQVDFAEIEQAVMVENNLEKARALVTPEMLKIGIVGTADDLIKRLEKLVDLGVRHISFGPPLGPDPLEAIRIIGEQVLPYFADEAR